MNCVRTSPDYTKAVSISTDKKIVLIDTTSLETIGTVENAHAGGIYSLCWWPDGSKFATCSADKTIKIWKTEGLTLL